MIVFIEEIEYKTDYPLEVQDFLMDFSIASTVNETSVIIKEQKSVLNEISVNYLFSELFHIFKIEYSELGGYGCDFSIQIKKELR